MYSKRYSVKLTGQTPLLLHNDNIEWTDTMDRWKKDPANKKLGKAGDDRTPAWRWIGCVYTDGGVLCIPSDNIMTMLREGGAKCPTGKGQLTFKRQTQSGIVVDTASWPLLGANGVVRVDEIESLIENDDFEAHLNKTVDLGFALFVKRAPIGQSKHVRVRPRFDVWSCEGTLTVFDETITEDVLVDILNVGGAQVGLCDWRPSSPKSPGPWGKFTSEVKAL